VQQVLVQCKCKPHGMDIQTSRKSSEHKGAVEFRVRLHQLWFMNTKVSLPKPPMLSKRLPLLGHALEFARDRGALLHRGYAAHGKIFAIQLATKMGVVLVGPEYATLFFKETDKALDMAKPYQFLKPIIGNAAFVADHATYLNQKPMLYAPFQREKMLRYLEVIDETVREWLDTLPDQGRMELTSAITDLVQQVAGRSIMGEDFMQKAGKEFWSNYAIIGKALDPLLPANLPLPKFIRRDRARKRMAATLRPILAERRANPAKYDDLLQDFMNTPKADGTTGTDEEFLSLIIALMFAGHETTAGQAAWSIIQLLQNPDYLAKVQTELDAYFPHGARVNAKSMASLKHLKWAVDETTRMKPSADIMIRVADIEMEIDGFRIPKGTPIFITAEVSQFLPEVFHDPEAYHPERFSSEECSHKDHKNAIIGFGGGMHKCPGMNFALNEMVTICAHLFQRFEVQLETLEPGVRRDLGANRPTETWVRFQRKPAPIGLPLSVMEAAAAAGCPHMAKALATKAAESMEA
jgi:sterol 14alpha-demethylase